MAGNRKHGFMRGNKAGSNGVGQSAGFFCDACQKQHGPSVERVGISRFTGQETLVCNRKYLQFMGEKFNSESEAGRTKAINQLKRLKLKIRQADEKGTESRIKFLCIALKSRLHNSVRRYDLFDEHNLGERDLDTCVEMGDLEEVIFGVFEAAKKDYWLKLSLKQQLDELGAETYQSWLEIAERHVTETQNQPGAQQSLI